MLISGAMAGTAYAAPEVLADFHGEMGGCDSGLDDVHEKRGANSIHQSLKNRIYHRRRPPGGDECFMARPGAVGGGSGRKRPARGVQPPPHPECGQQGASGKHREGEPTAKAVG